MRFVLFSSKNKKEINGLGALFFHNTDGSLNAWKIRREIGIYYSIIKTDQAHTMRSCVQTASDHQTVESCKLGQTFTYAPWPGIFFKLAWCGYTLRVTSQASYSPEYITPTQKKIQEKKGLWGYQQVRASF
jgi:hypothetical protein